MPNYRVRDPDEISFLLRSIPKCYYESMKHRVNGSFRIRAFGLAIIEAGVLTGFGILWTIGEPKHRLIGVIATVALAVISILAIKSAFFNSN